MSELLLSFARTMNDGDPHLPKGRGDCFDIGQWGGCGVTCCVFLRGECKNPEELMPIAEKSEDLENNEKEELRELYKGKKNE